MSIIVNLDVMMAKRKMSPASWPNASASVGQPVHFKNRQGAGHPFFDAGGRLRELHCQPGDILEFREDEEV
jgi:putative transcriptional regulator